MRLSYKKWKRIIKLICKTKIKAIRILAAWLIGYFIGLTIRFGRIPLEIQHINNKIRACERYGYE